jgi:hypothetical protein
MRTGVVLVKSDLQLGEVAPLIRTSVGAFLVEEGATSYGYSPRGTSSRPYPSSDRLHVVPLGAFKGIRTLSEKHIKLA